jgi:hypothetical protein
MKISRVATIRLKADTRKRCLIVKTYAGISGRRGTCDKAGPSSTAIKEHPDLREPASVYLLNVAVVPREGWHRGRYAGSRVDGRHQGGDENREHGKHVQRADRGTEHPRSLGVHDAPGQARTGHRSPRGAARARRRGARGNRPSHEWAETPSTSWCGKKSIRSSPVIDVRS